MPTQEERLTILEYDLKQYKTETIEAYGEMAIEMTMVKGLTEDAVKRLASLKTEIEQRFVRLRRCARVSVALVPHMPGPRLNLALFSQRIEKLHTSFGSRQLDQGLKQAQARHLHPLDHP